MTKYIYAEKLIAEIERRIKFWANREKYALPGQGKDTCQSRVTELTDLLSFIDSLQQEQPKDLASLISEATTVAKRIVDRDSFYNSLPQNLRNKYTFEAWCEILETLSMMKEQEQPEKSQKGCNDCPYCVDRKDQYGWHFKGCFGGSYKGKFIAEIDKCPLKQEQPEVDLGKAAQHVYGSWMGGTMDDVRRDMVELGKVLNARKEESK